MPQKSMKTNNNLNTTISQQHDFRIPNCLSGKATNQKLIFSSTKKKFASQLQTCS